MALIVPLPLQHSWLMPQHGQPLDLGELFGAAACRGADFDTLDDAMLSAHGIGRWSCGLPDNRLRWSGPVFDLFGLPRDATLSRDEIVALYCDGSRAVMDHLRSYAIRHRRGFTIDAEIRTVGGERRWMRLLGAPVCDGNRVVRLQGLKQDVSHHYQ